MVIRKISLDFHKLEKSTEYCTTLASINLISKRRWQKYFEYEILDKRQHQ